MKRKICRLCLLTTACLVLILFSFKKSENKPEPLNPTYTLWYDQPAKVWQEALPVGNGRLGAMVFGRVNKERLQLNDITIWSGKPEPEADRPEAYKALPEIRKAISEGNFQEAQRLCGLYMLANEEPRVNVYNSKYFGSYQELGSLNLDFGIDSTQVAGYRRWLDIDKAIAGVEFKTGDNTFTREIFSSAVDGVIVVKLKSEKKGKINFTTELTRPASAKTVFEVPNTLVMTGNTDYRDHKGNCNYEARVSVVTKKGNISGEGDKLTIKDADEALILITCGTSYIPDFDMNFKTAVPHDAIVGIIKATSAKPYEKLRKDHIADYQKYFRRVSFDLGQTEAANATTVERLSKFNKGSNDPGLMTLFYQYGRCH